MDRARQLEKTPLSRTCNNVCQRYGADAPDAPAAAGELLQMVRKKEVHVLEPGLSEYCQLSQPAAARCLSMTMRTCQQDFCHHSPPRCLVHVPEIIPSTLVMVPIQSLYINLASRSTVLLQLYSCSLPPRL